MTFRHTCRTALIAGVFADAASLASVPAQSGHQRVFINGQLVHRAVVAQIQQAIGMALPSGAYLWDGQYLYDGYGNAVPLAGRGAGPTRYPGGAVGEVYPGGASAWGNPNTGIGGVYDPSGGCEAGSCVNILN